MTARTVVRRKVIRREAIPEVAREFSFDEADLRRISEALSEPDWLLKRRLAAYEAYRDLPMPSLKDEAWRRTDIRLLPSDRVRLAAAEDIPVDASLLEPLAGDVHGALLVVRPGHPPVLEGGERLREQGVVFADWATAVKEHAQVLEKHLGTVVRPEEGKFGALAAAFAQDGVVVYVPAGVQVEDPLHTVVWVPGGAHAFCSRVLVVLEPGASLTYTHEVASPTAEGDAVYAGTVELSVGDEASLTFVELQNLGRHVWNFTHERARVGRDGRLHWIFGAVGSHLTKNFTELDLVGQGAEGRMSGFYFADGVQHLDHDTQQNHLAPHTTSDLLFKGALVDKSRSVWQGMIYVAPGAQKTDGYQANRNLILSKQARADSIPGLEILADDVRCTHGATVGRLEEEPVFYLMSRGLTRREAERLVIDGFFAEIMARIPFENLRERFQQMIDAKLQ